MNDTLQHVGLSEADVRRLTANNAPIKFPSKATPDRPCGGVNVRHLWDAEDKCSRCGAPKLPRDKTASKTLDRVGNAVEGAVQPATEKADAGTVAASAEALPPFPPRSGRGIESEVSNPVPHSALRAPHLQYLIRVGPLAVHFHKNIHDKRVYTVCTDAEATKFSSKMHALVTASEWKMQLGSFRVDEFINNETKETK